MSEEIKNNRFVFTVLKLLEPMGDIDCTALSDEIIGLSKNNTMFALIVGPELYLRTKKNDTEIYQDKIDVKGITK
jgi:TfoX/Sxy family transcriptional regulator of competence genes